MSGNVVLELLSGDPADVISGAEDRAPEAALVEANLMQIVEYYLNRVSHRGRRCHRVTYVAHLILFVFHICLSKAGPRNSIQVFYGV